jgi:hypothetical protein
LRFVESGVADAVAKRVFSDSALTAGTGDTMKGLIDALAKDATTEGSSAVVIAAILALGGTVLTAVITALITLVVYWLQQRQKNRKPFLQRQLDLCFAATQAAASLASEVDTGKWKEARTTFWQLYWGPLSIVESREVEAAMFEFGKLVPTGEIVEQHLPVTALQIPSYELAHAVRKLILKSWGVHLSRLEGVRKERSPTGNEANKIDAVNPKLRA